MSDADDFLNPKCTRRTLDIFGPRYSIVRALEGQLSRFHGTLLDVGCGRMPYKTILVAPPSRVDRYIGLDLGRSTYGQPDVLWDGRTIPLEPNLVECAMATEVFEHCPDPVLVMREIARVLKPAGLLFFTVPFLWPLHDVPHDEYRYTPFAMERLLREAGLAHIETWPLGGWDSSLAQMIGLWIRRRPMSRNRRRFLSIFATLIVRILFKQDHLGQEWKEGLMFTGMAGTASKPLA